MRRRASKRRAERSIRARLSAEFTVNAAVLPFITCTGKQKKNGRSTRKLKASVREKAFLTGYLINPCRFLRATIEA
jgi:hypothetical protein